jgi:hypothetical protein
VGIIKTPYQNLMLDKWVLKTEERPIGHMSFLPQEVVRCEVWTGGFYKRHNYIQRSPRKKMQLNIYLNEWAQYTSQSQFVV